MWLPDAPVEFKHHKREVLQRFTVGPRVCMGKKYVFPPGASLKPARVPRLTCYSLAYAEMRLLLAKMSWHFDFELDDPEDNWYGK
jgi:hypothetical protein